jgi:hypothetical protein
VAAAVMGAVLILDSIRFSSATYDEVAYLRVAARWWRTGEQTEITRMGSPLSFWKLQQAPVFWVLDQTGRGSLIDDPIARQEELLSLVRGGALWIWLVALALCALWSRRLYGPRAMALASWLFALSPNLVAHGGLVTMELPLVGSTTGLLLCFWMFLVRGRQVWLWTSAALGGLAFSCKYTTVLIPPILLVAWTWDGLRRDCRPRRGSLTRQVILGMAAYALVMVLANLLVTGFAVTPLSGTRGEHPSIGTIFGNRFAPWIAALYERPLPQDWVGLAAQVHHQLSGGPSYLLGERRMTGWSCYYFVCLAVKVPVTFWLLVLGRLALLKRHENEPEQRDEVLPLVIGLFLIIAAVGSSRNYGFRYLLPLAPVAIVWVSRLAQETAAPRRRTAVWPGGCISLGIAGQVLAVGLSHPYELTYFNCVAGGPRGGRHILSDSNLDWGQGLKGLAQLQRAEPDFRDLTFFYFGDTDPAYYGVKGATHVVNATQVHWDLPQVSTVTTRYLAVSASLQWGPWGPPGFFDELKTISPVRMTPDTTIAIYCTGDLKARESTGWVGDQVSTDRVRVRADLPAHRPARRPSG